MVDMLLRRTAIFGQALFEQRKPAAIVALQLLMNLGSFAPALLPQAVQ